MREPDFRSETEEKVLTDEEGGVFFKETLKVRVNIAPWCVRELLAEIFAWRTRQERVSDGGKEGREGKRTFDPADGVFDLFPEVFELLPPLLADDEDLDDECALVVQTFERLDQPPLSELVLQRHALQIVQVVVRWT